MIILKKLLEYESQIKASIEVYEIDPSSVSFYLPLTNGDKFMLFKKDK